MDRLDQLACVFAPLPRFARWHSAVSVGLAACELRDQRHDWRRILGASRESPQDHAHVLAQCACEARARKELHRIAVVRRALY